MQANFEIRFLTLKAVNIRLNIIYIWYSVLLREGSPSVQFSD